MSIGTGHGEKQSRLWEQAISALLETTTITAAAKQVGVDESTLRAWLRTPTFLTPTAMPVARLCHAPLTASPTPAPTRSPT